MSEWTNMKAPNLGLLFYKQIYKEPELIRTLNIVGDELQFKVNDKKPEFKKFYDALYEKDMNDYNISSYLKPYYSFCLYTTYPGLLTGSGYPHDTKSVGDFKIGFFFDHTTGLPVIPGSSVKGTLRTLFEADVNEEGKNYTGEKSTTIIKSILFNIIETETTIDDITKKNIITITDTLKVEILLEAKNKIFGWEESAGNDIFFDASTGESISGEGAFIGEDYITPHYPDVLKNPKPLQFLKVLPNVKFKFEFKLSDEGFDKEVKLLLFKHIFLTVGIGAKTNVGYGQFSEKKQVANTKAIHEHQPNTFQRNHSSNYRERDKIQKQDLDELAEKNRIENKNEGLQQNRFIIDVPADAPSENTLKVGDLIKVVVLEDAGDEVKNIYLQLLVRESSYITIPKPEQFKEYKGGERLTLITTKIENGKVKGLKKEKIK